MSSSREQSGDICGGKMHLPGSSSTMQPSALPCPAIVRICCRMSPGPLIADNAHASIRWELLSAARLVPAE
jgi:hypothetical protein